jgi:hypothetical protein
VAQFAAQLALFSQSIVSALGLAQTPEKCDEQLARLLVQLEEIEGQFGEHEQFLGDIAGQARGSAETFEARQSLQDERQRKAQGVLDAALRIVQSLPKRTESWPVPMRCMPSSRRSADRQAQGAGQRLREQLHDPSRPTISTAVKGVRDQALRALQDRSDLYEGGGA